ncbi:MAG: ABC transporter permease [Anaerolineae bacterium]|nr:ABC transporter permease [Anaerolineae bacterium]
MLSKITAIAWKDTIIRFSSKTELLFFLILPIIFIMLLGGAFGGSGSDEDFRILLIVVDEDQSDLSQSLLESLQASGPLRVETQPLAEAEAAFADKEAPALLHIPTGFAESVSASETAVLTLQQQPNNSDAQIAAQAVETAVTTLSRPLTIAQASLQQAEQQQPFANETERVAYLKQGQNLAKTAVANTPTRVLITFPTTAPEDANDYDQAAHGTAGQLITWVFIPLLGTSGLLAFERRYGTLRRLLVAPTGRGTYLSGIITGQFGAALVQMALLVVFGAVVMKVNWGNSPAALAVMLVTFGLASVAFGVMLGTFVKTEGQASNLSIMLGMSMALLGGCWWPLELFPPAVQTAVHILPTTWAMQGLSALTMQGAGLRDILPIAAILCAYAVVFFTIGVIRFRAE